MNTSEIISDLPNLNHNQLVEVRQAVDARIDEIKTAFMTQAAEMGLACHDENGKPKRKPRANASKQAD